MREGDADAEAVDVCPKRGVSVGMFAVLVPTPTSPPFEVEGSSELEGGLEGETVAPPPPTFPAVRVVVKEVEGEKVIAEEPVAANRAVGVPPPKPSPLEGEGGLVLVLLPPPPPPPSAPPDVGLVVGNRLVGVIEDVGVPPPPPPPAPEEPLRAGIEEKVCAPVLLPPAKDAELEGVAVAIKGV